MPNQGNQRWVMPQLKATPDISQGEQHLMADALLAAEREVPLPILLRAVGALNRLGCMSEGAA